jgi:hypothetical protein
MTARARAQAAVLVAAGVAAAVVAVQDRIHRYGNAREAVGRREAAAATEAAWAARGGAWLGSTPDGRRRTPPTLTARHDTMTCPPTEVAHA